MTRDEILAPAVTAPATCSRCGGRWRRELRHAIGREELGPITLYSLYQGYICPRCRDEVWRFVARSAMVEMLLGIAAAQCMKGA